MAYETQLEREERYIEEAYEHGEITTKERDRELRELSIDFRSAAEEAAQEAYDREMERW